MDLLDNLNWNLSDCGDGNSDFLDDGHVVLDWVLLHDLYGHGFVFSERDGVVQGDSVGYILSFADTEASAVFVSAFVFAFVSAFVSVFASVSTVNDTSKFFRIS